MPIEISNVCVPVLHLDLGIYPWLFEAMEQDAENIDLALAKSARDVQSSTSFNEVAAKQNQLRSLTEEKVLQEEQVHLAQTQLQWVLLNAQQANGCSQSGWWRHRLVKRNTAAHIVSMRNEAFIFVPSAK